MSKPDGWIEVWAIASVGADGEWECLYTTSETMLTDEGRRKELAEYGEDGRRVTLIRAYVPPPEPPAEVVGEVVG